MYKKILMFLLLGMFLISFTTAVDWDNSLTYSKEDKTVLVENLFGLPIVGSELAELKITSHDNLDEPLYVGTGWQEVMVIEVDSKQDYSNFIKGIEFRNMKTNSYNELEYYWEKAIYGEVIIEDTHRDCSDTHIGPEGKEEPNCYTILDGTHKENGIIGWEEIDGSNIGKEIITLRLMVYVNEGDYYDGIPELFGKKIGGWAEWTSSLDSHRLAYYQLNETSGTTANDYNGTYDFTVDGKSWNWGTGKIGNGYVLNNSGETTTRLMGFSHTGATAITRCFWANRTGTFNDNAVFAGAYDGSLVNGDYYIARGGGNTNISFAVRNATDTKAMTNDLPNLGLNQWTFICARIDNDGINVSFNNTFSFSLGIKNYIPSATEMAFVWKPATVGWDDMVLDEDGYWNRYLTNAEVTQLYNGGVGITPPGAALPTPVVIIVIPIANSYSTATHDLNYTASSSETLQNCWYSLNKGETNSTIVDYGTNWSSLTASEGSNTWTTYCNVTTGEMGNTTVDFSVDTINPNVNLTFPINSRTYFTDYRETNRAEIEINWTATDTNIQSCVLFNGTANETVTCGDNVIGLNQTFGSYNFTLWANDSIGNFNSSTVQVAYNYSIFKINDAFSLETVEGNSETFRLNVSLNPGKALTIAYLFYNNTNQGSGTITSIAGSNYTISKSITVPEVISSTNKTFYWNLTLSDGINVVTTSQNQTISNFSIDDCSSNSNILYNFTIIDEEDKNTIANTTQSTFAKLNMQIYGLGSGNLIEDFNNSYQSNSFSVCLNDDLSGGVGYYNDLQIQYGATGYSTELYHIQNATLNSTTFGTNISLYDLNSTDTQVFKIIFRDSSFLPVEDALIKIYRKYVSEGVFKIVEIPKTDKRGESTAHLVLNDVIYNIQVVKFGTILETFSNVIAVCQTPLVTSCEIDLNAFAETIIIQDFATKGDFNFTLGYTEATRTVTSNFLIPSGGIETVELVVTREDALGTAVCTDSLVSSSGLLSCVVPNSFGNTTISAKLYVNGYEKSFEQLKIGDKRNDIYGAGGIVVLSIFIMLTLLGAGLGDNPISMVIFLAIGVILLMGLNLIDHNGYVGGGASVLFLFAAIILILIKGSKRN